MPSCYTCPRCYGRFLNHEDNCDWELYLKSKHFYDSDGHRPWLTRSGPEYNVPSLKNKCLAVLVQSGRRLDIDEYYLNVGCLKKRECSMIYYYRKY